MANEHGMVIDAQQAITLDKIIYGPDRIPTQQDELIVDETPDEAVAVKTASGEPKMFMSKAAYEVLCRKAKE